ncbi:hypothetical protein PENSPDRAFT_656842 [Peniophora sp. CONT]|nr:hypothetical protein PENSPDRAFT_656842 [Peniophora sp. CONT]
MFSNTVLDASNLPMDVIRLLFDHAATIDPPCHIYESRPPKRFLLGWITLAHVCHDWRNVGLSMPLLWASIVTTFPDPLIASELLARAGSCAITVDLIAQIWDQDNDEPMYPWISANIAQVGVLKLRDWKFYNTLRKGDEKPLPLLHTIYIGGCQPHEHPLHTLPLCAPGLRSATLTNIILPSSSTCTLRELELNIWNCTWASLSGVHEFLRCCLQLERLHLEVLRPSSQEEYHAIGFQLKKLKSATLSVDSEQTAWDLWRPMIVPDDIVLKIVCKYPGRALSRPIPLLLDLCATQLRSEHYDAVEFEDNTVTVYELLSNRSSNSCTLYSSQYKIVKFFHTFPAFVCIDNIRTLTLASATLGTAHINEAFRVLGRALPRVTSLSLKRMTHWPTSLYIRALGRGMPAPIFPVLQVLRVSDMDPKGLPPNPGRSPTQHWWDTVKAALKARLDAGYEPLQFLVLDGTWPNAGDWNREMDGEELRECRSRGLVQEIDDHRTFIERDA